MEDLKLQRKNYNKLKNVALIIVINCPLIIVACCSLNYVFVAGDMKYRCLIPECEDAGNTTLYPPWISSAVPNTTTRSIPMKCSRYLARNLSNTCSSTVFTNETQSCDAWVYDPDEQTILSEWDITCDSNRWMLTLVGTFRSFGIVVGLYFAGSISDRYGRRKGIILGLVSGGICGLIRSFSVNYLMFIIFEFMDAALSAGVFNACFVLGVEQAGTQIRTLAGIMSNCMYAMGDVVLGFIAMWIRSWRKLIRVFSIALILVALLPLVIPESTRWTNARDNREGVEEKERNKEPTDEVDVLNEDICMTEVLMGENRMEAITTKHETGLLRQALTSRIILTRIGIFATCWFCNNVIYYGLSLNSVFVSGDKYFNFVLVSVVELPACFLNMLFMDKVGRRTILSGSLLLSGAFCVACSLISPAIWSHLPLLLFMGGKFCATITFNMIFVFAAELFPTTLRNSLINVCNMAGKVGTMLATQTPLLADIMESLPLILFGCMGLIAGLLILCLPESLGKDLPDTIAEAERITKMSTSNKKQQLRRSTSKISNHSSPAGVEREISI